MSKCESAPGPLADPRFPASLEGDSQYCAPSTCCDQIVAEVKISEACRIMQALRQFQALSTIEAEITSKSI